MDVLFPKYCVNCGLENDWLCFDCAQKIIPVVSQVCPECGKLSERGKYHVACSKGKTLKGIIASAYFEEGPASPDPIQGGPIREMIHNFKYNGVTALAEPLAKLMAAALIRENKELRIMNKGEKSLNSYFLIHNSILTFVPMHWRRRAQRGYNHSEILARNVGKILGLEVEGLLVKKQATRRQAELSGAKRRTNLSGVFAPKTNIDIKKRQIIIIDDVTTTGSTLNECAAVLKLAGAKEVWGLVVSRG